MSFVKYQKGKILPTVKLCVDCGKTLPLGFQSNICPSCQKDKKEK